MINYKRDELPYEKRAPYFAIFLLVLDCCLLDKLVVVLGTLPLLTIFEVINCSMICSTVQGNA